MMKKNFSKALSGILTMAFLLSCALLPVAAADSEAAPTIGNCENLAPDTLTGSLEFKSGAELMWLKALDQVSGNTWYIQQTVNFTGSRNMESLDINIAASGKLNSGGESTVRVRLVPEQDVWQIVTATGAIYTPANTALANGTLASAVELNRDYIVTVRVVDGDKMSLWVDGKQLAIDVALSEAGLTDLVPAWGWRVYGPTGTISNIQVWDGVTTKCPTIGNCENLAPAALAGSLEFKSGAEIKWLEALDQVSGNTWYVQQTVNYTTLNAGESTDIAIAASGTINSGSETIVRVQLYAGAKRWGIAAVKGAIYTWTDPLANGSGSIESEIETGKDYVITVQVVDGDKVSIWLDGKLLIRNFSLADAGYTNLNPVWGYRAYSQTGTISNIQVWDGVTLAPVFTEAVADISAYRKEGAYTAPTKDGYVFAGWFTDAEATSPVADETTNVYAKFVTQDVLSVKGQLKAGTTAESLNTDYRFSTTVDSLNYQNIGFNITVNGNTKSPSSTTVYKKITARSGNEIIAHDPTVFSAVSQYFHTYTITGIPQSAFATEIQIAAYWTTLDGTVVTGPARTLTVNMGIN